MNEKTPLTYVYTAGKMEEDGVGNWYDLLILFSTVYLKPINICIESNWIIPGIFESSLLSV